MQLVKYCIYSSKKYVEKSTNKFLIIELSKFPWKMLLETVKLFIIIIIYNSLLIARKLKNPIF